MTRPPSPPGVAAGSEGERNPWRAMTKIRHASHRHPPLRHGPDRRAPWPESFDLRCSGARFSWRSSNGLHSSQSGLPSFLGTSSDDFGGFGPTTSGRPATYLSFSVSNSKRSFSVSVILTSRPLVGRDAPFVGVLLGCTKPVHVLAARPPPRLGGQLDGRLLIGSQAEEALHASLAVGPLADNDRPAVVLERRGDDLAGAGAVAVDQHRDRLLLGGQEHRPRAVGVVGLLAAVAVLGGDDLPLGAGRDRRPRWPGSSSRRGLSRRSMMSPRPPPAASISSIAALSSFAVSSLKPASFGLKFRMRMSAILFCGSTNQFHLVGSSARRETPLTVWLGDAVPASGSTGNSGGLCPSRRMVSVTFVPGSPRIRLRASSTGEPGGGVVADLGDLVVGQHAPLVGRPAGHRVLDAQVFGLRVEAAQKDADAGVAPLALGLELLEVLAR